MEILNYNLAERFYNLVADSKNRITLCSPYVKSSVVENINSAANPDIKIDLLTKVDIKNFAGRASDCSALKSILEHNHRIYNVSRLHAKVYIFDESKSIITSANLTTSGLQKNYEYGVYIDDVEDVETIVGDLEKLKLAENTGVVRLEHLIEIEGYLSHLTLPRVIRHPDFESIADSVIQNRVANLIKNLTGWKKDVFSELLLISKETFETEDLVETIVRLKQKHPNNHNIEAKIRQQLQVLRDLGFISFEGRGVYKKLWI